MTDTKRCEKILGKETECLLLEEVKIETFRVEIPV